MKTFVVISLGALIGLSPDAHGARSSEELIHSSRRATDAAGVCEARRYFTGQGVAPQMS